MKNRRILNVNPAVIKFYLKVKDNLEEMKKQ